MSTPAWTRERWLGELRNSVEAVGECLEWQGAYMGKTPLVYCPAGMHKTCMRGSRQSVRSVLWALAHGEAPQDQIIRAGCGNWRCVLEQHWQVLTRRTQTLEQSKRGEFATVKRRTAGRAKGRARAKLDAHKAHEIRHSPAPSLELAQRFGVSRSTITAIRRGQLWSVVAPGAWAFGGAA